MKNNFKHPVSSLLIECAMMNNHALDMEYPNGGRSLDYMFEDSKLLPRKKKKHVRKMIDKAIERRKTKNQ